MAAVTANPLTIRALEADISRITGRRYEIHYEILDERSLRELRRLLRDLEDEKRGHGRRARFHPWRG